MNGRLIAFDNGTFYEFVTTGDAIAVKPTQPKHFDRLNRLPEDPGNIKALEQAMIHYGFYLNDTVVLTLQGWTKINPQSAGWAFFRRNQDACLAVSARYRSQ